MTSTTWAEAICAVAALLASSAISASPAWASDSDRACAAPKKYIAFLQQRNFDGIAKLFAANAVFYTPLGTVLHGSGEIGDFYKTVVASANLIVKGQNFVGDKTDCFFEIWQRTKMNAAGKYLPDPDGEFTRGAIDHFTVDDRGRVVQMVAAPLPNHFTIPPQ